MANELRTCRVSVGHGFYVVIPVEVDKDGDQWLTPVDLARLTATHSLYKNSATSMPTEVALIEPGETGRGRKV